MMPIPNFSAFENKALAEGFEEVVERIWPPDALVQMHMHPFSVKALVVQGEMWLTAGDQTRHLVPGDVFELGCNESHAERYGALGATYWAARKTRACGHL